MAGLALRHHWALGDVSTVFLSLFSRFELIILSTPQRRSWQQGRSRFRPRRYQRFVRHAFSPFPSLYRLLTFPLSTFLSGQVPDIPRLQTLIDTDTPLDVYSVTGHDGDTYNLVFSDEVRLSSFSPFLLLDILANASLP
jgi:hypothetical protein